MNSQQLFQAIGNAEDALLERSEQPVKKKPRWHKWLAAAACICLLAAGGLRLLPDHMGANASGSGHDNGAATFMSYAGPVFPLTLLEDTETITAKRSITLDFSPWLKTWISNQAQLAQRSDLSAEELTKMAEDLENIFPDGGYDQTSTDILVQDTYQLRNQSAQAQTVTVLYPFVSDLYGLKQKKAQITVNGTELSTSLVIGGYSGGFQTPSGDAAEPLLNLEELHSWEQYQALLQDGDYLSQALSRQISYTDVPVIVYRFTDDYGPASSDAIPNPTIRAMFELDYGQTTILTYGFNGHLRDSEQGLAGVSFSVRQPAYGDYGQPCYLIVLGQDISALETQAYITGGWDTKKTLENAGVTIIREETTLETVLQEVVQREWQQYQENLNTELDLATYYQLFCDYLERYGVLANPAVARYDEGALEFLDVNNVNRVCYTKAQLIIPAGSTMDLTATVRKEASFDYACANTAHRGIYGYDLVTQLGSNLTFTDQQATIKDYGVVEITGQNFGFDLLQNRKTVNLSNQTAHYYLEVKRIAEKDDDK